MGLWEIYPHEILLFIGKALFLNLHVPSKAIITSL